MLCSRQGIIIHNRTSTGIFKYVYSAGRLKRRLNGGVLGPLFYIHAIVHTVVLILKCTYEKGGVENVTNFFSLRRSIDLVELVRAMIFFSISLRSAGKINAKNPSICSRRPALY